MRETRSLDGADWRFEGYLGRNGALRVAARPHDAGDGRLPAAVPGEARSPVLGFERLRLSAWNVEPLVLDG